MTAQWKSRAVHAASMGSSAASVVIEEQKLTKVSGHAFETGNILQALRQIRNLQF